MIELAGQPAELRFTIEITRENGEKVIVPMVGRVMSTPTPSDENKENNNVGHPLDDGA